ncbi:FAD-dependent oxidoreductase [Atrimonas thermophila]|uniref:oxidoreductase n=1 Tax=Atrimonas thermophila TaxID=3064161 RepID=UPI00399C8B94
MKYPNLFSPLTIKKVELRNRIVMPPMATNLGSAFGEVTSELIEYYRLRAAGGVGLIIIENAQVDMYQGRSLTSQIAVDDDKFLAGLKALAEAIHVEGAKTFLQIQHGGRQCTPSTTSGLQPVAPSPIACKFLGVEPRELSTDEIKSLVDKFVQAALRAKLAGFDGVEIHAAHGYLINEFLSPYTNKRSDEYGGSFENRLRFLDEIIDGIRQLTGEDFVVGVRLSVDEFVPGGIDLEQGKAIAKHLEEKGIDYLSVSCGIYESVSTIVEPVNYEEGWRVYLAEALKKEVSLPIVTVGVIRHPEFAEKILAEGKADLVAVGRGLIADPEWPKKAFRGEEEYINYCISCNVGCIGELFANGKVHCAINPWAGREFSWGRQDLATCSKKVVVVGGGPAGMEAAMLCAQRGHEVVLIEKEERLGGQLLLAATAPGKDKIRWFLQYLERMLQKLKVRVITGEEATPDKILAMEPDVVFVATGGEPIIPEFSQLEAAISTTAWDVLKGKITPSKKEVAVIGGGMVGCETALYLSDLDNKVYLLEMLPQLAQDAEVITRIELLKELNARGNIIIMSNTKCMDVIGGRVVYLCEADPQTSELHVDYLVFALGTRPRRELFEALKGRINEVYLVGDARSPRKIYHAVLEAANFARQV